MTRARNRYSGVLRLCMKNTALLVFLFGFLVPVSAGGSRNDGTVNFTANKQPFIHSERNELVNAKALDSFFHKLFLLKTEQKSRISVLQIGDSHIQADFLS